MRADETEFIFFDFLISLFFGFNRIRLVGVLRSFATALVSAASFQVSALIYHARMGTGRL